MEGLIQVNTVVPYMWSADVVIFLIPCIVEKAEIQEFDCNSTYLLNSKTETQTQFFWFNVH